MSEDLDGYEPAIEPTSHNAEASVESEPAGKAASAAAAAQAEATGEAPAEKIGMPQGDDEPVQQGGPRQPRVWSGKSRALFRQLASKGGVGAAMADDLEPMEHTPAAKPAPAAQPAAATPTPAPAEREQQLAAREAALAEREKLLPDRRELIKKPAETVIRWLSDTYGIKDPAERKTAIADLITEISAHPDGLGIGVPDEHQRGAASRRSERIAASYASEFDQRERALRDREAEAEKKTAAERAKQTAAQQEAAYVGQIGERLAAAKERFPFLNDTDLTNGQEPARIVYEVMKEQRRQANEWAAANPGKPVPKELQPSLATATKFADKYYRDQAEAIAKVAARHQSRLGIAAPAAASAQPAQPAAKPAAPAPAASASPGGAPGPAPTPAAKPEPQRDPSDLPDKRAARAATFAKIRGRAGNQPTT